MGKDWYPVINYDKCLECGACVRKCPSGVYIKEQKRPEVVNREGCVYGCRGCQRLCPAEAISYFGDDGKDNTGGCSCSCCCDC